MTRTLTHTTKTGDTFTRRTEADYRYVSVKRTTDWDGNRHHIVLGWHNTEAAAKRKAGAAGWAEQINNGKAN